MGCHGYDHYIFECEIIKVRQISLDIKVITTVAPHVVLPGCE